MKKDNSKSTNQISWANIVKKTNEHQNMLKKKSMEQDLNSSFTSPPGESKLIGKQSGLKVSQVTDRTIQFSEGHFG